MTRCFHAGMSCSQIAAELDVTRNAIIGKLHRLGLTRASTITAGGFERRHAPGLAQPQRSWRAKRTPLSIAAGHEMMNGAPRPPRIQDESIPILNGRGLTLLELGHGQCRWPIGSPGTTDFCFCGNEPVKGLSYCPGHARMAYRPAARRRGGAGAC
jgi:GcrA cell cycle regulator